MLYIIAKPCLCIVINLANAIIIGRRLRIKSIVYEPDFIKVFRELFAG